jgi:GTP-binding protein HflX
LPQQVEQLCRRYSAVGISALHPATLRPLLARLEAHVKALVSVDEHTSQIPQDNDAVALATYE